MLDTHFALEAQAVHTYEVNGRQFRYHHFHEGGKSEVFSGMSEHAKWLQLEDIQTLLREQGFRHIEIAEKRSERNGARVLLFARRSD